jgi:serine/threonine-protein kinase
MGEVWRAYDTTMDRVVVLKVLAPNFADDEAFKARFHREARSAARLNSPHVIPIHDYGEIDGRLYVTMGLIEGRDLQTVLADGPLPPARAVRIVEQVATALHAAHEIGLVHCDVKPSNILLDKDDYAYLINFGIARAAGETGPTTTGAAIGTWAYMAPERFQTGIANASADIYALTCVLYQSLTGQRPFPRENVEQIIAAQLLDPPPQPSMIQSGVTAAMDHVIATGMAKLAYQRYPTTEDLAQAARDALNPPTYQRPKHPIRRSPGRPIGVAWLEEDGSITLDLRRTSDGQHVSGILRYKPTDEHYNDVLEHLGGLKPGETKPVPPWPD